MTDEKKESVLILPDDMDDERPLTALDEETRQEFCDCVLRRCTSNQLTNGLREAIDSYTFGRGDSIDDSLIEAYELELADRKKWGWANISSGRGGDTMDKNQLRKFSLFIKRHAQYIFSSTNDGVENRRYM